MAVECARRGYDVYLTDISEAALANSRAGCSGSLASMRIAARAI
jgi:hypothetical protein